MVAMQNWRMMGVLVGAVLLLGASLTYALDIDDIKSLMRNQVAEDVIINMARTDGRLYITMEEAAELRRMGASDTLITALRPRPTSLGGVTGVGRVPSAPTVVGSSPSVVAAPPSPLPESVVGGPTQGAPVTPVPIIMSSSYPPRYDKEGWLSISNRDWMPYYININAGDKRIFLSRAPNGGMALQSGQNIVVNLRKNTYKTYGESGEKLEVKVRENETTTLSLDPFGVFGNSGLTGVAVNRDRVRSEVLFNNYLPAQAVVVQEPSVIVVPSAPAMRYYRPYRGGMYFSYDRW